MLLIDAGNSRLKWVLRDNGQQHPARTIGYGDRPLPQLFEGQWSDIAPPKRVLVINVAGPLLGQALASWVRGAWSLTTEFVQVERDAYGVRVAYDDPSRLGVDRWVGLLAARHLLRGAVCVIDCGSAITLDVMTGSGEHVGGVIVPGVTLMQKSLVENTQGIGLAPDPGEYPRLARDTSSAVRAGSHWAAVGFIDRMVEEVRQEIDVPLMTVITGGDAPRLLTHLTGAYQHEPDWLFKGLAIIAEGRT